MLVLAVCSGFDEIRAVVIVVDDVNVTSEEMLYKALIDWVNHDLATRTDCLPGLLSLLKLPLMSPEVRTQFCREVGRGGGRWGGVGR